MYEGKKLRCAISALLATTSLLSIASAADPSTTTGNSSGTGDSESSSESSTTPSVGGANVAIDDSGNGQSKVPLHTEGRTPDVLSVTVPAELPIAMDSEGAITVSTNAKILNQSVKPVEVKGIGVTLADGWGAANYQDDFSTKADDLKELSLKFREAEMNSDGTMDISNGNWAIASEGELGLEMGAKMPFQTEANDYDSIATVQYTIGWAESKVYTIHIGEHNWCGISSDADIQTDNTGTVVSLPTVTKVDPGNYFDHWENADTGEKVEIGTRLTGDITINVVLGQPGPVL